MPRKDSLHRTYPEVGRTIREARLARGWSQDDLAKAAKVSRRQITLMEAGGNSTLDYLERVLGKLGLSEVSVGTTILRVAEPFDAEKLQRDTLNLVESIAKVLRLARVESFQDRPLRVIADSAELAIIEPEVRPPVRIYLVEDDVEHEAWRKRLIDFASRSDQLAWREGRHTPAKYHSPLQGNVAAGHGAEIQPVDDEDLRQIPDYYWEKRGARFALRVYGQSLERRGIFEHDLVYVRPTEGEEPRENSIVIAEIDNQIVCKIWRRVKGKPMLYSASPAFPKPIDPSRFGHFAVKGVVVGRSGDTHEAEAD